MTTDLELLQDYARNKSEASFTALVNRHLNLVYSAALRQVRSPQLAEEVAQSTFMDLARQAQGLAPDTVLTAWLYQVTRRTAINVVRGEARRQTREQAAYELTAMNPTENDWTQVEALLDEAMHTLDEPDRTAVLLRYFESKSLREVGQVLGASDNAAQKRISRAVERLREFFTSRGAAIGTSGLVVAISTNAVQAAPIGLAATISTAVLVSGTTLASSTAAAASITKAITMTTLQKALIAVTCTTAVGTAIFEAHKASTLETQVQTLQQQQAPLGEQMRQLESERDEAAQQLAALRADNERLNVETSELLKLRGEVAMLRRNQGAREPGAALPSPPAGTAPAPGPSPMEMGRELGMAVVQGQPGAFDKLLESAKAAFTNFNAKNVGLNDQRRGELQSETFMPLHAAFKVIEEAALGGSQLAIDAVVQAMQIPQLKGNAVQCIGALAGNGDEAALEVLLNPRKYDLLPSSVVGSLQPAADKGNQKAIDALAAVANDATQPALWYQAASGLEKSAGTGNAVAIDALIGLSASPNRSVRMAVMRGLKAAAANQDARAAEALRLMGPE